MYIVRRDVERSSRDASMILKACCFFPPFSKTDIFMTRVWAQVFSVAFRLIRESLLFVSKCVNVKASGIGLLDMFGGLISRYSHSGRGGERGRDPTATKRIGRGKNGVRESYLILNLCSTRIYYHGRCLLSSRFRT